MCGDKAYFKAATRFFAPVLVSGRTSVCVCRWQIWALCSKWRQLTTRQWQHESENENENNNNIKAMRKGIKLGAGPKCIASWWLSNRLCSNMAALTAPKYAIIFKMQFPQHTGQGSATCGAHLLARTLTFPDGY